MTRVNAKDARETFKGKYTCIIKNNRYSKQIVTDKISKVLFENCDFSNIKFKNVEFKNVIFSNCKFYRCTFEGSSIYYQELLVFDKCEMVFVDWVNCQFSQLWCIDTILHINQFNNTNLFNSIFYISTFKQVDFKGNSSIEGVSIIRPIGWLDIEFDNNQGLIKVNQKTNITKFDYKSKVFDQSGQYQIFEDSILNDSIEGLREYNSDAVGKTFLNFAHQFKLNSLEEEYGKYYYIGKREIHKKLPFWSKFKSFIGLITCGYGEKWHYGLLTSLAIILSFSFFYMSGLELSDGRIIKYNFNPAFEGFALLGEKLNDYVYCLHYSFMTFVVGDYSNFQTIGTLSHILSFIQMILGILLIAIITGSILRKMFR